MRHKHVILMILICIAVFCLYGYAHPQTKIENGSNLKTHVDKEILFAKLEKEIPELMEKALIPGLSIAIIRDGKLFWHKCFGVKNAETDEPVTEETIFESASTSKPVFAYAVMKLVERGELDLDTPLVGYAPISYLEKIWDEYNTSDERFKQITTRMVLTHSTGFPNWLKNSLYFEFDPGEKWGYSGSSFVLLGSVIEKITGLTLDQFIDQEVLTPLKMKDSWFVWLDRFEAQATHRHNFLGRVMPQFKYTSPLAAGSLYTTAKDFAKFLLAVINESDLCKDTIAEMLTPQIKVPRKHKKMTGLFWGLGFGLNQTNQGISFWHWGDNGECKAYFEVFKTQRIGLVYFANGSNGLAITDDLLRIGIGLNETGLSKFADYPGCESPELRFYHTYARQGASEAVDFFNKLQSNPMERGVITPEKIIALGREALIQEDLEGALNLANAAVNTFPEFAEAYSLLGEIYMNQGYQEEAIKSYKMALEINPNLPKVIQVLEQLEAEQK